MSEIDTEAYFSIVDDIVQQSSSMLNSLLGSRLTIEAAASCLNEDELKAMESIATNSNCELEINGSNFALKLIIKDDTGVNFLDQLEHGAVYYTVGKGGYRTYPDGHKEKVEGGSSGRLFFQRHGSDIAANIEPLIKDMFFRQIVDAANSEEAKIALVSSAKQTILNKIQEAVSQ